jgi:dCTP deaminase
VSLLSAAQVKGRIYGEGDAAQRLVISPILEPKGQLDPAGASVDLRMGTRFTVARRAKVTDLDSNAPDFERKFGSLQDEYYVPIGDYFVLHPNHFVLGETLEYVRLPADIGAYVVTRSSWGRHGLVIATAVGIHPLYFGIITLELRNLADIPLRLHPGKAVLQLFFHSLEPPLAEYPTNASRGEPLRVAPSRYLGSTRPEMGKALDKHESEIIRRFQDFKRHPIKLP